MLDLLLVVLSSLAIFLSFFTTKAELVNVSFVRVIRLKKVIGGGHWGRLLRKSVRFRLWMIMVKDLVVCLHLLQLVTRGLVTAALRAKRLPTLPLEEELDIPSVRRVSFQSSRLTVDLLRGSPPTEAMPIHRFSKALSVKLRSGRAFLQPTFLPTKWVWPS